MHESQLINQSIGYVLCGVFPAVILVMTVAYVIKLRRERRDENGQDERDDSTR